MILTRSWLEEWIDLSDISTDELCATLNAIGLEVDRVERFRMPERIVVGKVLACEKHPDADKLNVCRVDVGDGDVRQIVCGASNVAAEMFVPVALVGATIPGGLEIKPVKLRGVDSAGMICSAGELGLPKLGEGILALDESIGSLETGKALREYALLNDDLIEIELTANRGDCLSIRGVARDLCAALDRSLKAFEYVEDAERRVGIGKLLKLEIEGEIDVNVEYHAADLEGLRVPLAMVLRLAQIEVQSDNAVDAWLAYVTHATGVILRAYPIDFFMQEGADKPTVVVKKDAEGFVSVFGRKRASIIGIRQEDEARAQDTTGTVIIEASYIDPEVISRQVSAHKIETGPLFYRTSRGSEPELSIGVGVLLRLLEASDCCQIYGGKLEHTENFEPTAIGLEYEYMTQIIGAPVDKGRVARIFTNLGFDISKSSEDHFVVVVPRFRHDIANRQDLIEEVVRIVGIDNIPSKPFVFAEADRLDADYFAWRKRQAYRRRAAQSGFFESVHFVFGERSQYEALGFECLEKGRDLLNPIASTLDTLRPTLTVGLLNAASQNVRNGRKRVPLFEIGSVFDANRNEKRNMALLFSGAKEEDALDNAGKPEAVDFAHFTRLLADVVGDVAFRARRPAHRLAHPYRCAAVVQNGCEIGEVFTLHPSIAETFDLPSTVVCELDFDALEFERREAKPYSKFQASFRDLSLVVPVDTEYARIAEVVGAAKSPEVVRFYPVDRYRDETMGETMSLTLRFVLQSDEKTLGDEDITGAMKRVLEAVENELGARLR